MSDESLWLIIDARGVPATRIEAARRRRRDIDVIVENRVALTARIDEDFYGYSWQRAAEVASVIPPFTADDARRYEGERWAHAIARALRESPASPLYAATWVLGPWSEVYPAFGRSARELLYASARDAEDGHTEWDLGDLLPPLLLRRPPPERDARVKAWRKFARAGNLPPLLLWWVSGLDRFIVLDGAARLVAAVAEGIEPPALALAAARIESVPPDPGLQNALGNLVALPTMSVSVLNSIALRAYGAERIIRYVTRAWPRHTSSPRA